MCTSRLFRSSLLLLLTACIVSSACNKGSDDNSTADFDRPAMLRHYADDIIRPAFTELDSKVKALKTAADAFADAPTLVGLDSAKAALDAAYSAWMRSNSFNFGPAGEQGIRKGLVEELGTWPVDEASVESKIAAGGSAPTDFNRANRGLPAVEYLLHKTDAATNIAAFSDANRRAFLKAILQQVATLTNDVAAAWNGAYRDEFIAADGTDVGSSTAQMYNEFVRSFESLKNFKVALPLGGRAGQTNAEPDKVEARYNGQSLKYLTLHLRAIEDLWEGKSFSGADGVGWKEYLQSVEGGADLVARTEAQTASVNTVLAAIPQTPTLAQQIVSNPAPIVAFSTELQKQTRNYKSDMSSLLGIAITFSSGDGD